MLKKLVVCSFVLTLCILLDPTLTPAQPPSGFGKGGKDRKREGDSNAPSAGPGFGKGNFGNGGFGFKRPEGAPGGTNPAPGGPTFGPSSGGMNPGGGGPGGMGMNMSGPGGSGGMGGPGGPGGRRMGGFSDPEANWKRLLSASGDTGDTLDLSKIPPETHTMIRGFAERTGGIPLPESGVWTKEMYLEFSAKNEAARASFAGNGSGNGPDGRGRGGDSNNWMNGGGGWGQGGGGWGQGGGGWGQGGWDQGQRPSDKDKKESEEERPVAMRYGKLPKGLPNWYDENDTDKDGQVSLYEWRKSGRETKEFLEMDLNGDGLVTADEYLRFARQKNIDVKVAAYEEGTRESGNWGLGEKLNPGDSKGDRPKGPGGPGGWGGGGSQWGGGGNKGGGGDNKGEGNKGERGGDRKGNPWGKK